MILDKAKDVYGQEIKNAEVTFRVQTVYADSSFLDESTGNVEKIWLDTNDFDEAKDMFDNIRGGSEIEVEVVEILNIDDPQPGIDKIILKK